MHEFGCTDDRINGAGLNAFGATNAIRFDNLRDAQGLLNQRIAAAADIVEFVAAGLPLRLKG